MRTARSIAALGCGVAFLLTIGCGPTPKDQQIQALQEEVSRLQAEKTDLLARLRRAEAERDAARAQVAELQRQLAAGQVQPPPQPVVQQRGPWTEYEGFAWQDISDEILFDSGKADLKSTGRGKLQSVLDDVRQRWPDRQIWIVGHTDTDPIKVSKWKDNLELSVQRAATVFREMNRMGVDPTRMVAAGQGEFHPKGDNSSRAGKQQNRRVQIIAVQVPEPMARSAPTDERG